MFCLSPGHAVSVVLLDRELKGVWTTCMFKEPPLLRLIHHKYSGSYLLSMYFHSTSYYFGTLLGKRNVEFDVTKSLNHNIPLKLKIQKSSKFF